MEDRLNICERCNSNACYEFHQSELTTWFCFGCGFTTNSEYNFNNKQFKLVDIEASLPELIKDLRWISQSKGYIWYPTVINQDGKGIVFPDGNSIENWKWNASKHIEVKPEEKEKYKNQKYKIDKESIKFFEQLDFLDALEYVGYFN